jgi:hypothetical protein
VDTHQRFDENTDCQSIQRWYVTSGPPSHVVSVHSQKDEVSIIVTTARRRDVEVGHNRPRNEMLPTQTLCPAIVDVAHWPAGCSSGAILGKGCVVGAAFRGRSLASASHWASSPRLARCVIAVVRTRSVILNLAPTVSCQTMRLATSMWARVARRAHGGGGPRLGSKILE